MYPSTDPKPCIDSMPSVGCYTWEAAKAYCESLDLAGGGWRLPYVRKFLPMARALADGDLDEMAFPHAPSGWYWSATNHWMISFGYASLVGDKHLLLRCVR